jgi:hypothetical protein
MLDASLDNSTSLGPFTLGPFSRGHRTSRKPSRMAVVRHVNGSIVADARGEAMVLRRRGISEYFDDLPRLLAA